MTEENQVPLLGADLSLKRIQNQFSSSKLLTFAEATKENFLKNINQFGIIQLYSHAEAKEQGSEPYLVFADTILNLSELQFIEKSLTQLIILSACNTGVGEFMKGEGIFSLARAFSAAGIPSGINSLWKINTKSTFQVTELFHQFISDGLPTDVALQKAKMTFIANGNGNEKLPYFWGANVLVGPAFTFQTTKYSWPWITFGVFVAACLTAGVLYLKKTAQRGKA
jgi:CHAT domain-containing protein